MVLYQKRIEILRATRQEIIRYGIAAFRVEEIARLLGMSKRTIYRIFPTKANLLRVCVAEMTQEINCKIKTWQIDDQRDPLDKIGELLTAYVDCLYNVEGIFLREIKQLPLLGDLCAGVREAWTETLLCLLVRCKQEGYVLADTNLPVLSRHLLIALYESRVTDDLPRGQQMAFWRTVLRGSFTWKGINRMEEREETSCLPVYYH